MKLLLILAVFVYFFVLVMIFIHALNDDGLMPIDWADSNVNPKDHDV
jgi:hypothetical protein